MSLVYKEAAELFKGRHCNHEIITLCVRSDESRHMRRVDMMQTRSIPADPSRS